MFAKLKAKLADIRLPKRRRIALPDFGRAYRHTGKGWIHRMVSENEGWSPSMVAWVEKDVAKHVIINSSGDILFTRTVRQSAMESLYPDKGNCYFPADTASIRRQWIFSLPGMFMFFFGGVWLMLVIGYNSIGIWPMSVALWGVPVLAPFALALTPLGVWAGYRFAPKPIWVFRFTKKEGLRPLEYEREAFQGSLSPAYIYASAKASDIKEYGEGVKVGGFGTLRAGAFIAGIVGICVIIWLATTSDTGSAPLIETPPPVEQSISDSEEEGDDVEWQ